MPTTGIALPAGTVLQEYRIEATLGAGGFGLTYLATDTNLNLAVALKEYLPGDLMFRGEDLALRPRSEENRKAFDWGRGRFLDESRTLASFRHPSIVRVMRFFEANGTAYMVMEFVEGQTLQAWIKRRRPLPENVVLALAAPLLDGLAVIHGAGYLHRDIKPNNIFVREDGSPVLLDFGSARVVDAASELTVIVSPGYAPLEQYHGHGHQGPWSDLYAFGGVLYWMVTGTHPLEAPARARNDPMPPALLTGERALYSGGLLRAIDWALAPAEEDRPQSVADFRAALLAIDPDPDSEVATLFGLVPRIVFPEPSPPGPATGPPTGAAVDSDTLQRITSGLAAHIGPIAGVVVKSAAKRATGPAQLVAAVAAEIADEGARAAFVKAYGGVRTSGPPSQPSAHPSKSASHRADAPPTGPPLEAAVLARAEAELAKHLGGVAKAVVRRAAAKTRDEAELYRLLAEEIDNAAERQVFLGRVAPRTGHG